MIGHHHSGAAQRRLYHRFESCVTAVVSTCTSSTYCCILGCLLVYQAYHDQAGCLCVVGMCVPGQIWVKGVVLVMCTNSQAGRCGSVAFRPLDFDQQASLQQPTWALTQLGATGVTAAIHCYLHTHTHKTVRSTTKPRVVIVGTGEWLRQSCDWQPLKASLTNSRRH